MEDREKPEDNVQKMGPVENLEVKNLVSPLNLAKSLLHVQIFFSKVYYKHRVCRMEATYILYYMHT